MKIKLLIISYCFILTGLKTANAQNVEIIKYNDLQKIMNDPGKDILVLNFWATWCKPCIIEMPHFQEAAKQYKDKMRLIFVSLDFADNLESKVIPFIKKRNIKNRVVLLDDLDYNSWIDKVDPRWSGAIPATVIINGKDGEKYFFEKEFTRNELNQTLEKIIN